MLDCRLKEHHQGNSEKGDGFILPLSLVFSDFDISPAFGFSFQLDQQIRCCRSPGPAGVIGRLVPILPQE